MIITIITIILLVVIFSIYIVFLKFKLLYPRKNKIEIYNKISKLQYNRLNNSDSINRNPILIFADDLLENSYTVLDKIV